MLNLIAIHRGLRRSFDELIVLFVSDASLKREHGEG
jgi:hypothetical protein